MTNCIRPTIGLALATALAGCVAQPRLKPPPRCSTRFPATTAAGAGQETSAAADPRPATGSSNTQCANGGAR